MDPFDLLGSVLPNSLPELSSRAASVSFRPFHLACPLTLRPICHCLQQPVAVGQLARSKQPPPTAADLRAWSLQQEHAAQFLAALVASRNGRLPPASFCVAGPPGAPGAGYEAASAGCWTTPIHPRNSPPVILARSQQSLAATASPEDSEARDAQEIGQPREHDEGKARSPRPTGSPGTAAVSSSAADSEGQASAASRRSREALLLTLPMAGSKRRNDQLEGAEPDSAAESGEAIIQPAKGGEVAAATVLVLPAPAKRSSQSPDADHLEVSESPEGDADNASPTRSSKRVRRHR